MLGVGRRWTERPYVGKSEKCPKKFGSFKVYRSCVDEYKVHLNWETSVATHQRTFCCRYAGTLHLRDFHNCSPLGKNKIIQSSSLTTLYLSLLIATKVVFGPPSKLPHIGLETSRSQGNARLEQAKFMINPYILTVAWHLGEGLEGYAQKNWVVVCGPLPKTLIYHDPYGPDQNSIPGPIFMTKTPEKQYWPLGPHIPIWPI